MTPTPETKERTTTQVQPHGAPSLPCTCVPAKSRNYGRLIVAILFLSFFSSCNVTKYLPEGEYLYNGSSLQITAPSGVSTTELTLEAQAILDNKTNTKLPLLGYYEIYRHYRFLEKLERKPDKFGDKEPWGKAPVFYDEELVASINRLLESRGRYEGYLSSASSWELDTLSNPPQIKVDYTLQAGRPHRIDSLTTFWRDSSIARVLNPMLETSLLSQGKRYEIDLLQSERMRWEQGLRNAGFYYARGNDFTFLADTISGDHKVALLAKQKEDVSANHTIPQRITAVNVYFSADKTQQNSTPEDAQKIGGLNVFCDDCPLRPKIIDEAFAMEAGDLYNPERHRKTLQRLADYNTFRYIAMSYDPVPGADSLLILNANLEPRLRRRFEGELGLTFNSADYFGPNGKITYLNRNLLRGAELLRLEGEFSIAQFLGEANAARVPNSGLYGFTAQLNVPRLWLPMRRKLIPRVFTSNTVIELGAKLENLQMNLTQFSSEIEAANLTQLQQLIDDNPEATERISLTQLRFQFGYTWRRRTTISHALNPLSLRLQNPVVSNEEVLDLAREVNLAPGVDEAQTNRFDRMLVFSPNYTYNLDTRLGGASSHHFFLRQFISFNVNNVFPVGSIAGQRERETSYYPLLETDARYYLTINNTAQLAMRFHGGIAFPLFSDRAIVPYFDLFSVGGPNSLRGFAPRQVGPGKTVPFANNLLTFGGYGNLMLEGSLEYRHRIDPLIELALFADAGNIWTYKTELEALETDFRTDAFSGDLAVNAGLGIRFDLEFLLLRIDLAKPLITPYAENAKLLRVPYADARNVPDDDWRLVVAFGYPF